MLCILLPGSRGNACFWRLGADAKGALAARQGPLFHRLASERVMGFEPTTFSLGS